MESKNKFVTNSGLDYDGKKWITDAELEIALQPDNLPSGFGRSITPGAFRKMISSKLIKLKNEFIATRPQYDSEQLKSFLNNQKCAVEFGKETILRVLSQKNCTGLRFTFCVNDVDEESIIVSGLIEENGKTSIINKEAYRTANLGTRPVTTLDDEKGVGLSYGQFANEATIDLDDLLKGNEAASSKIVDNFFGLK